LKIWHEVNKTESTGLTKQQFIQASIKVYELSEGLKFPEGLDTPKVDVKIDF
jgi:hypothetical protein